MARNHDASYKLLFSSPRMVRELLRGFVPPDCLHELDFDTLERVSTCFVSDDLRQRIGDMVWRVKAGADWVYLYIVLEFQSTVDRYMAVRMMDYSALLYLNLIRDKGVLPDRRLPPLLPIVLYNGDMPWNAQTDIAELIPQMPPELSAYQPRFKYLLIDAGRYSDEALARLDNLVAAVFRFENPASEATMIALVDWIKARVEQDPELTHAFMVWLTQVVSQQDGGALTLSNVNGLTEARMSLAATLERWKMQYREEGLQQGMQRGVQQGEAQLLRMQLAERFGPLPDAVVERLESAAPEQLTSWGLRLLRADSLNEVFRT